MKRLARLRQTLLRLAWLLLLACGGAGADVSDEECAIAPEPVAAAETAAAPPVPATAAPALPPPPYAKAMREQARKILKGPDFHAPEQRRELVMRDWLQRWLAPDPERKAKPSEPLNLSGLAELFKIALAVVVGLALLWLLWRGWQWLAPRMATRSSARVPPRVLEAGTVALDGAALPDAVSAVARAAWQRGDAVLALSLLYRGAVRSLAQHHRIELPDSATEGECLRLARQSGKAVVREGFAPIVRAWMALAYARRTPDDFESLLQVYRRCFEPAAGEAT